MPSYFPKCVTDHYRFIQKVGEGTYGLVWKAWCLENHHLVAIKKIKPDPEQEGVSASTLREVACLLELDHPNIIKILSILSDVNEMSTYLVYEWVDCDLYRLMKSYPKFLLQSMMVIKKVMWQLLKGLDYCHRRRVIHRDIKPQNILVDMRTLVVKIADFGLSRMVGLPIDHLSPEVITLWYRPPELLLGSRDYSAHVDTWGIGCILYEMTQGGPLFPGVTEIDQICRIVHVMGRPTEKSWPGVSSLPGYRMIGGYPRGLSPDQGDAPRGGPGSSMGHGVVDRRGESLRGGLGEMSGWMTAVAKEERERQQNRENHRLGLIEMEREPEDILQRLTDGSAARVDSRINPNSRSTSFHWGSSLISTLALSPGSPAGPRTLPLDADGLALLRGLLSMNPAKRWTPRMALESDFFTRGSQDFRREMTVAWEAGVGTVTVNIEKRS